MNNKPCPYCGEQPQPRGTRWVMCLAKGGCPNRASAFTPEQWNRRFVCLDKNGEKVFVGDKVSWGSQKYPAVACTTPSAKLAPSGVIVGAFNNIELVKEDT